MHATLAAFNYPASVIRDYDHWVVLLRPKQVTLGSCVIVSKSAATAMGEISATAFAEYATVCRDLESALSAAFQYDKINYLALMMVVPQVHYHVLPRYIGPRNFACHSFTDSGWPKPPTLGDVQDLSPEQLADIQQEIIRYWPQ